MSDISDLLDLRLLSKYVNGSSLVEEKGWAARRNGRRHKGRNGDANLRIKGRDEKGMQIHATLLSVTKIIEIRVFGKAWCWKLKIRTGIGLRFLSLSVPCQSPVRDFKLNIN